MEIHSLGSLSLAVLVQRGRGRPAPSGQVGTETWSVVGPKGDYNSPLQLYSLIFEGLELGSSPRVPE